MNIGAYTRALTQGQTEQHQTEQHQTEQQATEAPQEAMAHHVAPQPHATESKDVWEKLIDIYSKCYHLYNHMALQYQLMGFDGHKRYWRLTAHVYRQQMLKLQHDGVDFAGVVIHGSEPDYSKFPSFSPTDKDSCKEMFAKSIEMMLENEKHYHDKIYNEMPLYLKEYAQNKIYTIKFLNRWHRKGVMSGWDIGALQIQDKILHDKLKEMEKELGSY